MVAAAADVAFYQPPTRAINRGVPAGCKPSSLLSTFSPLCSFIVSLFIPCRAGGDGDGEISLVIALSEVVGYFWPRCSVLLKGAKSSPSLVVVVRVVVCLLAPTYSLTHYSWCCAVLTHDALFLLTHSFRLQQSTACLTATTPDLVIY